MASLVIVAAWCSCRAGRPAPAALRPRPVGPHARTLVDPADLQRTRHDRWVIAGVLRDSRSGSTSSSSTIPRPMAPGTSCGTDRRASHGSVCSSARRDRGSRARTWRGSGRRSARATTCRRDGLRPLPRPRAARRASRGGRDRHLVVGSRYMPGGSVTDWSRARVALSRAGNIYARLMLGLPIHDATSGYRVYRAQLLRSAAPSPVPADGYGFQVELVMRAWLHGWTLGEVPITFRDREHGQSKISEGSCSRRSVARHRVGRGPEGLRQTSPACTPLGADIASRGSFPITYIMSLCSDAISEARSPRGSTPLRSWEDPSPDLPAALAPFSFRYRADAKLHHG